MSLSICYTSARKLILLYVIAFLGP